MMREHDCPHCGEPIEVDDENVTTAIVCPECDEQSVLSHDGEFANGQWRDLTRLIKWDTGEL